MAEKSLTFNLFGRDVSASKAMDEFASKSGWAVDSLSRKVGALAGSFISIGAVVSAGKWMVNAAAEAETQQTRLNLALKNTNSGFTAQSKAVEDVHNKYRDLGFTGAEVDAALTTMTTGLGSGTKALGNLQLAADLARYKNISLSDAALLVTKAWEGQTRPLKQLGIDLPIQAANAVAVAKANTNLQKAQQAVTDVLKKYPDAADSASKHHAMYEAAVRKAADAQATLNEKMSSGQQIVDSLSKKLSGEATKSAQTFAGQQKVLSAQFDELGVEGGKFIDPILEALLRGTNAFLSFSNEMSYGYQQIRNAGIRAWADMFNMAVQSWSDILGFISGHPIHGQIIYSNVMPPAPSGGAGGSLVARPFATGGIVRQQPGGVRAILAEAGSDEAVLPLNGGTMSMLADKIVKQIRPDQLHQPTQPTVNVNITEVSDPVGTANAVLRRLNARGAV